MCFAILCCVLLDFRACNLGLEGPQKPKTHCDNKLFAILSFTSVFTVRSGALAEALATARSNYGANYLEYALHVYIHIVGPYGALTEPIEPTPPPQQGEFGWTEPIELTPPPRKFDQIKPIHGTNDPPPQGKYDREPPLQNLTKPNFNLSNRASPPENPDWTKPIEPPPPSVRGKSTELNLLYQT